MSASFASPEPSVFSPEPRTLNSEPSSADQPTATASRKLPPSERDFEIYEAVHVCNCSTWSQADKYDISQTRVRQIIRRVVEWLGEVLPPQAKVAKEQEVHLARQIAADRFEHQLEQATRFWDQTRELKYAGLRIRLTTAQARLGAVGGRIGGLTADAIEGIPVPAWQPRADERSSDDGTRSVPATEEAPAAPNPKSEIQNPKSPGRRRRAADEPLPWYMYDPIKPDQITPEVVAGRAAYGRPLPSGMIEYAKKHGKAWPRESAETTTTAPDANHSSSSFILPPSSLASPPIEDCSPLEQNRAASADPSAAADVETQPATTACGQFAPAADDTSASSSSTFQPLLTTRDPLPITQVQIAPSHAGAVVARSTPGQPLSQPGKESDGILGAKRERG